MFIFVFMYIYMCMCICMCICLYIYVYKTWGTTHALRFYCCAEVSHVGLLACLPACCGGSMHLAVPEDAQKTHQGEHMPQRNKAWLVPDGVLQREPENAQITAFEMVKHVYIYVYVFIGLARCIGVHRCGRTDT